MRELTAQQIDRLMRYLDAEMTAAESLAFEREIESDEPLREALHLLRETQRRTALAHPLPDDAPGPIAFAAPASRLRWRRYGVAAAIALGVGLAGWFGLSRYTEWANRLDAGELYARTTISFEPQVVCDTPEKFATYTDDVFGVRITPEMDGGVQWVGWRSPMRGYDGTTDDTVPQPRLLLVRAEGGEEIVVLFQRAWAWEPDPPQRAGMRMFSRRIGGVTMWEITPLDEPVVLGLLERGG